MPSLITTPEFTRAKQQYPAVTDSVVQRIQSQLQLEIMTLGEYISFRGDPVPTTVTEVNQLATTYTEHLGKLCTRFRHGFVKYQNVDNEYIHGCLTQALARIAEVSLVDSDLEQESVPEVLSPPEQAHLRLSLEQSSIEELQEKLRQQAKVSSNPRGTRWKWKNIRQTAKKTGQEPREIAIQRLIDCASESVFPDPCAETEPTEDLYDFILAVDVDPSRDGIVPSKKYHGIETSEIESVQQLYQDEFVYREQLRSLNRIHGFLVIESGGCQTYHLNPQPNIVQLSVLCTSPYTDRNISGFCSVGTYLIGTFILLAYVMGYETAILEVANECVGDEEAESEDSDDYGEEDDEGEESQESEEAVAEASDEDLDEESDEDLDEDLDEDSDESSIEETAQQNDSRIANYGSREYQKGKDSQKRLYCYYERFGFRENSTYHTEFRCFGDSPYPSMALDLTNLDVGRLCQALTNPTIQVQPYSTYCNK